MFCATFVMSLFILLHGNNVFAASPPAAPSNIFPIASFDGTTYMINELCATANNCMRGKVTGARIYVPKSSVNQTININIMDGCDNTSNDKNVANTYTQFYVKSGNGVTYSADSDSNCRADKSVNLSFVSVAKPAPSTFDQESSWGDYDVYEFVGDAVGPGNRDGIYYFNSYQLNATSPGVLIGVTSYKIPCAYSVGGRYQYSCPTSGYGFSAFGQTPQTVAKGSYGDANGGGFGLFMSFKCEIDMWGQIEIYDLDAGIYQQNLLFARMVDTDSAGNITNIPDATGIWLNTLKSSGNDGDMFIPGDIANPSGANKKDPYNIGLRQKFLGGHNYTLFINGLTRVNTLMIRPSFSRNPDGSGGSDCNNDLCDNIPGLQNVLPAGFSDPLGSKQCTKPDAAPKITFTPICDVANNRFYIIVDTSDPDGGTSTVSFSGTGIQPSPRSPQTSNSFIINRTNPEVAATLTASTDGVRPNYFRSPQKVLVGPVTFVPCVYSFSLTPFSSDPSLDDDEQPKIITSVNFSTTYVSTSPSGVKGILDDQQTYLIKGGKKQPPIDQVLLTKNFLASDNINRGPFNINSALVAGDMICTIHIVNHGKGFVDISGNLTNYKLGPQLSSPASCVTIVNKPYLRTYGADVVAGGGFGGNCSSTVAEVKAYSKFVAPTGNVGSGSQLGVFASKDISGFLSMSLANAIGSGAVTNARSFSNKTVAGIDLSGKFGGSNLFGGNFGTKFCSDDLWTDKGALKNATGAPINTFANGSYLSRAGKLNVGPVGVSNKIAIYVNGDLQIDKDIVFANTANWGSLNAIPSIYIVVLGNIYIDSSVTKLDGYYVAQPKKDGSGKEIAGTGRIYTCADNGKAPSSSFIVSSCNKKLTINGSFVAAHVNFLRSNGTLRTAPLGGELSSSANIAESFEFSPELLLAVPAIAPINTTGTYDYMVSLPPAL